MITIIHNKTKLSLKYREAKDTMDSLLTDGMVVRISSKKKQPAQSISLDWIEKELTKKKMISFESKNPYRDSNKLKYHGYYTKIKGNSLFVSKNKITNDINIPPEISRLINNYQSGIPDETSLLSNYLASKWTAWIKTQFESPIQKPVQRQNKIILKEKSPPPKELDRKYPPKIIHLWIKKLIQKYGKKEAFYLANNYYSKYEGKEVPIKMIKTIAEENDDSTYNFSN